MPLNFSAAHSSRITKKPYQKNPSLRRSSSSPFADLKQKKPVRRSHSKPETADDDDDDDLFGDRLEDAGIVNSLGANLSLRDVAQTVQHIRSHMFDAMPEAGGFNSTKIAEILNFRKSLPPTVTVAHVHTLMESPTQTEREIAELTKAGTIRKVVTPGRGTGGSSIGEGLILSKDVERLVMEADELGEDLSNKFLEHLRTRPMAQSINLSAFSGPDVTAIMRGGFLISSAHYTNSTNVFSRPDSASQGTVTSISSISRAASGSVAAVGGEDAIYGAGGRGGVRRSSSQFTSQAEQDPQGFVGEGEQLKLSLPGTGPYLKLLTSARSHMVSLVTKSKYRELPLYLLRERWNGGISADDPAAKAKKYRGEFAGILPNRTRKWKQFYGLAFDWVLAECLGAGLVEVFETGSVGRAVRIP
ncbi:hypothetical protein OEA41_004355 [Lepraria neglecta]|uniref:Serine-threonine protein kinase 19 n=1 Tax=Lepraria neglecta TaxID=209136 RepID=A0AAD9YXG6_9LECA|nr:hypothetical protein OEA41_004355 [Lepraria neglecta]